MVYQIVYKKRFVNKLDKLIHYLELNWNNTVVNDFVDILLTKIERIKIHPTTGNVTSLKNTRSLLVTKQNRIYYRIEVDVITILNMIDTRLNPTKNPFKKSL